MANTKDLYIYNSLFSLSQNSKTSKVTKISEILIIKTCKILSERYTLEENTCNK